MTDPRPGPDRGDCPVIDTDYRPDRPAFWAYGQMNSEREASPRYWNTTAAGFWMFTRYDEVREGLRSPEVFTNQRLNPYEPDTDMRLLPQNLDGLEHTRLRQVLNPWFSPGNVTRIDPLARRRAGALIDELSPRGTTDFVAEFAIRFPTEMFLAILGLPTADGASLVPPVEAIFRGFFGGDPAESAAAAAEVRRYFEAVLADREASPGDPAEDFVTYLLGAELDGAPLPRDDVVTICFTLLLAGLDTTRSELGYMWHHLATHPGDRQRLLDEPRLTASAIEEFLRLYSLILQDSRHVARDIDFHGCPMKEGDMVWFALASANRDPRHFDRPDELVMDRPANQHLGFGVGAHRCLGMHLARRELTVAVEEWHARIPHYRLAEGAQLIERGGQLTLKSLPLRWDRPS